MELVLLILAAIGLVGVIWLIRVNRPGPSALSDAALLRQLAEHHKHLERAADAHPDHHDAVLRRLAQITMTVKDRGLMAEASFVDEPLLRYKLEQVAHDKHQSTVAEIQQRASRGEAAGLYQLATLLRSAHEDAIATGFLKRAAAAGHADAQFALALETMGSEDDDEAAREKQSLSLLQAAANQGHGQAREALSGLVRALPPLAARAALRAGRRRAEPALVPALDSKALAPASPPQTRATRA